MPETSTVKKIYKWKPFTRRPVGRPKSRWEDGSRNDLKEMKLIKWAGQVEDRRKWKDIVEKQWRTEGWGGVRSFDKAAFDCSGKYLAFLFQYPN